jgi:putative spermidine/putrescine transport system ATP-binding protein
MTVLSLSGVSKSFGNTVALAGLDLELRTGEFVSLLGPSGCGKTTALRIAAGFERPDRGSVLVDGVDITTLPPNRRDTGMVFQSYSLFPNLTVNENIEFGLRTRRLSRTDRNARVTQMMELIRLEGLGSRYPHQLSGGQQQRVALARAVAIYPKVLLLDEPLSALDAKVRVTLRSEIRALQRELGITTLLVTHDQEEALVMSDRVGVMVAGRLEQFASPSDIYRKPVNSFVARFVGLMNELPGRIPEEGKFEIAGQRVSVDPSLIPAWPAGESATMLVRPENVFVGREPEWYDLCVGAEVVDVVFQGATTHVSLRILGLPHPISAACAGDVTVAVGDNVSAFLNLSDCIIEPATKPS